MGLSQVFDFTDKVAVVTGGSGVLGGELAMALGRRGAAVVVVGYTHMGKAQTLVDRISGEGGRAMAWQANALDRESLVTLAEQTAENFGSIDILINGAGGTRTEATTSEELSFFNLPEDAVRWVFDLNFMGTFLACQVFTPYMVKQDSGGILNIGSMGADIPLTRNVAYSAAKAAVVNFTQWLAVHISQEYSPHIRVNALVPGFFLTEQNRFLLYDRETGQLSERGRRILEHTPMARFGDPQDLVLPSLMLLSDHAGFVHGTTLVVDGAFSAYGGV